MGEKKTEILIVDDDPDIRVLARRILEDGGYTVLEADNAKAGLASMLHNIPHLVVTDLRMPGEWGYYLLEEKRKEQSIQSIPVVIFSTMGNREAVLKALGLGAKDYIVKPFKRDHFLAKIEKALDSRDARRAIYPKESRLPVQVFTPARVHSLDEHGFMLGTRIKVDPMRRVNIESDILSEVGLSGQRLRTSQSIPTCTDPGYFLVHVEAVKVPEADAQKIKSKIEALK